MRYRILYGSSIAAGTIAVAAGLLGTPAFADPQRADSGTTLEEVVVTAQKREEKLQNVPISITAVTSEQLSTRGIQGLEGLNAAAPNLMFRGNPGSNLISTIAIRGSTAGQPAIWFEQPVGVYLNGVYLGKAQGGVMDLVDLERVEVLRGPQGTLFGRNTEGGAINFITRKPTGQFDGKVSFEGGNYGHQIARFNVDLPRVGIASISVAGRKETMDGWARNLTGVAEGAIDSESFRLASLFDFSDAFSGQYEFEYSNVRNTPTPTSLYALSGWGGTFPTVFGAFAGTVIQNAIAPYVTTSRPDTVSTNFLPVFEHAKNNAHTVTLDYRLNDSNELKYIFSRRTLHYNDQSDIDGTPLDSVTPFPGVTFGLNAFFNRNTDYQQTSNELQWIGNAGSLKYVAGLYQFKDDGTTLGPQNFNLFFQPFQRSDYHTETDAKAAFGQLDYTFAERWTATAGMRYTKESKGGWTHRFLTNGFDGPFITDSVAGLTLPMTTYSKDFTGTTPMAALAFRAADNVNLYARVAKGFKSGGFSSEVTDPRVTTPFNPETSLLTELGVKSTLLGGKATLNFSVYHTKISDQQVTQLLPGTTQSLVTNAGKSTYQGFELEAAYLFVPGWKLQLSYGYLDAKFDQYLDNSFAPGRPIVDTASNRVPAYAPKSTVDVGLDGRLLATSKGDLRLILDYSYVSSMYLYAANKSLAAPNAGGSYIASFEALPAVPNLNVRLLFSDVPAAGGTAEFSLFVKNATNEAKQVQGIDFSMFRTANWEDPRTWMLTAAYKFGATGTGR